MFRVLVVVHSTSVRKVLASVIDGEPDMAVVSSAGDLRTAAERIAQHRPEVVLLDAALPRDETLELITSAMARPTAPAVVAMSSFTPPGAETALLALEVGAVDIVPRPGDQFTLSEVREVLVPALRGAARAKPRRRVPSEHAPGPATRASAASVAVVALGAATGGPPAIARLLGALPLDASGVLVAQHLPLGFTRLLAAHLAAVTGRDVREAREGEVLASGQVLVAPAGRHTTVRRRGQEIVMHVVDSGDAHVAPDALDVLFASIADQVGGLAAGAVLTGLGKDGARGLLAMRKAGARTFAESERTAILHGMPRAAIDLGGAEQVLDLDELGASLARLA